MRYRPLLLAALAALLNCATLDPYPSGTCGNGVVDANEDCDSFPASCGAPASGPAQCRLRCNPDPKVASDPNDKTIAACPEGWGCSVAGFCREPTGTFAAPNEPTSAGVATMVVGDFDGDGRADILGSGPRAGGNAAKIRVHYFGDGAALSQVTPFLAPYTSPSVHDFDKDGRSDFAFGAQGLGIMSGQSDRSFVPVIFPSLSAALAIAPVFVRAGSLTLPGGDSSSVLVLAEKTLASSDPGSGPGPNHYLVTVPGGPDTLLGRPQWGQVLDGLGASSCGEVVLAFDTAATTTIVVASPCTKRGGTASPTDARWWWEQKTTEITVTGRADGGILLADYDGDGHLDILVGVVTGTATTVWVVPSDKGTGFGVPYDSTKAPVKGAALTEMPLASADLNGDGAFDYVLSRGIQLSQPRADAGPAAVPSYVYLPGSTTRWSKAVIAHLNLDGFPDIVAAGEEQADLDFLAGTGAGSFTPSTISTSGDVTELAAGDFDGDLIPDLAFVQTSSATGETELAIAYGRATGTPEAPRALGRLAGITRISAMPRTFSALNDLAMFAVVPGATTGSPATREIALLLGSGDRQPIAPLLLSDSNAARKETNNNIARVWQPQAVVAGKVLDPNRLDLATVALGFRYKADNSQPQPPPYPAGLWVAQGSTTSPTAFSEAREGLNLDALAAKYGRSEAFVMLTAVGDLDKNGLSEVVALAEIAAPGVNGPAFHVLTPGGITSTAVPAERVLTDNQIDLLDVDADGFLDVVIQVDSLAKAKVLVYLNDGHGALAKDPIQIVVPETGSPPPGFVTGFAQVTTRGARGGVGRHSDLVVVTTRRAYLATYQADKKTFALRDLGVTLEEGTGAAAGDFDGDGVPDIALADRGAIRVLRQIARLP